MTRKRTVDIIVGDLMQKMIDKVKLAYGEQEELLLTVAPEEVGTLALGLAAYAMSVAAPTWLPQIRDIRGVIEGLAPKDRIALALLAARATEGNDPVKAVRADMAALRRMGRVA